MGLDIMVCSKLERVPEEEWSHIDRGDLWEYAWDKEWVMLSENYDCFADRAYPLQTAVPYDSSGNGMSFRAGSYSGYNEWRDQLARMAGYTSAAEVWNKCNVDETFDGPFVKLINFSDCEGTLGTQVAKALYEDFVEFEERAIDWADKHLSDEGYNERKWFLEKYDDWKEACQLAADNGCIIFG